MKILLICMLILASACNPELKNIGSSANDVVKYFKISASNNGLGDGLLIVANIGEKRLLTFYVKQPSGNYSHTDVMIKNSSEFSFEVDSIYSQSPDCKLNPDKGQPEYYELLYINGVSRPYNREILDSEAAMKEKRNIGC